MILFDNGYLNPRLFAMADKVVVDSISQAIQSGDTHHAIEAGELTTDGIYAELGDIAAGRKPGRESDSEITIADLTGLGVEDAAMANLVAERVLAEHLGQVVEI